MSISEHANSGNSRINGAIPQSSANSYSASNTQSSATATPTAAVTSKSSTSSSSSSSSGLPGAVSHIYYKHGLFLSSYPTCATSIAIVAILFSW